MKKPIITIEEKLPSPFIPDPGQKIPEFQVGEGYSTPTFGTQAMEAIQQFTELAHKLLHEEPLIVFWGLSGSLGCYYSPVKDPELNMEALNAKITIAKTTQPFSIYRHKAFELVVERIGGMQMMTQMPFEEAMLIVEGKKAAPAPVYEEPEEVEFDEDCTPECRPGEHKCGK